MSAYKTIHVSQTGESTQIQLAHPPRNIIGFEMMSELSHALDQAKHSEFLAISSFLTHFSTGVDVKIHTPENVPEMLDRFHDVVRKLYHFSGTTLCAIRGYALGGGLELAMCCDLIVAEQTATIGFPEITIACFPPVATVLLPRLIGRRANMMVLSGDGITALKAQEIGIVDRLYEDDDDLQKIIKQFTSLSKDARRCLKTVLRKSLDFDFDRALSESEKVYKEELLKSPDVAEGVQAFLEKRKPNW